MPPPTTPVVQHFVRWQNNSSCHICTIGFTTLRRRHHCRSCGGSVCDEHSPKRLQLKHLGYDTRQRVCVPCYNQLTAGSVK